MNITKRLIRLDPTLELHNESEWSGGAEAKLFSAFNSGGIEAEVGEFLYGLIRLLKPNHVLETGTHLFVGAAYMGMALKDNGQGHLDTIEFLPEIHSRARIRRDDMELQNYVTCHFGDAAKFAPIQPASASTIVPVYKLILLDTEPQTRFAELIKFYPYLEEGGFIFIHDLHRHMHQIENKDHGFAWPYGKIPEEMAGLVKAGLLRPFHFSTPRGLTGFYKPSKEDFIWQ